MSLGPSIGWRFCFELQFSLVLKEEMSPDCKKSKSNGEKRRKRVKKLVSKTKVNEEGFMGESSSWTSLHFIYSPRFCIFVQFCDHFQPINPHQKLRRYGRRKVVQMKKKKRKRSRKLLRRWSRPPYFPGTNNPTWWVSLKNPNAQKTFSEMNLFWRILLFPGNIIMRVVKWFWYF